MLNKRSTFLLGVIGFCSISHLARATPGAFALRDDEDYDETRLRHFTRDLLPSSDYNVVVLYDHRDYDTNGRNYRFRLPSNGYQMINLRDYGLDDCVSSLKVGSNVKVRLCKNENCGGSGW